MGYEIIRLNPLFGGSAFRTRRRRAPRGRRSS